MPTTRMRSNPHIRGQAVEPRELPAAQPQQLRRERMSVGDDSPLLSASCRSTRTSRVVAEEEDGWGAARRYTRRLNYLRMIRLLPALRAAGGQRWPAPTGIRQCGDRKLEDPHSLAERFAGILCRGGRRTPRPQLPALYNACGPCGPAPTPIMGICPPFTLRCTKKLSQNIQQDHVGAHGVCPFKTSNWIMSGHTACAPSKHPTGSCRGTRRVPFQNIQQDHVGAHGVCPFKTSNRIM